ncbi:hypothetical protein [uncultured Neptuniibacter sp.]|uniref:hypothetical protein n=1 Tax=uncultured Neptuniibacter sp. TaxID=502143 RepID=UPI0026267D41|nr:hypothetical protein [uncultured Neptuniibacter sp.]
MFRLVKDFINFQFCYYWIDEATTKVSPDLPTFNHAQEWIISYHFSQYQGPERRKRKVDRRLLDAKKQYSSRRKSTSKGRRITDKPISIDIDLAHKKLQILMSEQKTKEKEPIRNFSNTEASLL